MGGLIGSPLRVDAVEKRLVYFLFTPLFFFSKSVFALSWLTIRPPEANMLGYYARLSCRSSDAEAKTATVPLN